MRMDALKILSLILLLTTSSQARRFDRSNSESGSRNSSPNKPEIVSDYIRTLYECWRRKDLQYDSRSTERCLESAGESEQLSEILHSDTITGFIGNVIEEPAMNQEPRYMSIAFNTSCAKPTEILHSSELRLFKRKLDQNTINSLSTSICDLKDGVTVSLLADIAMDGEQQVVERKQLSREQLQSDDWIVFHNLKTMFKQWIQREENDERIIKIIMQGGCASISPENIGFEFTDGKDPLLLTFLESEEAKIEDIIEIGKNGYTNDLERRRRQIEVDIGLTQAMKEKTSASGCRLHKLSVNFKELGWSNFIIGPKSYSANYCSGQCLYPLSKHQNGTLHSQIQAYSHLKHPSSIPEPCCVPTKLISQPLIVALDRRTIQIKIYPGMTVTQCGCR